MFSGAPRFITIPHNILVAPGEAEVTLLCQAFGSPQPNIKWSKNGIQLPPSYKYDHKTDGALTVRNIDPSDHGNYQCEASNANGRITTNANLIIKGTNQNLYRMSGWRPLWRITNGPLN